MLRENRLDQIRHYGLALIISMAMGTWVDGHTEAGEGVVYRLDLSYLNAAQLTDPHVRKDAWDTVQVAASIQGIVNREKPRLFLRCMPETDDFWWNEFFREGGWLHGKQVVELDGLEDLLAVFREPPRGVVLYSSEEPFATHIATTIAGVEDKFVLREDPREDSLYQRLRKSPHFPAGITRVPSFGPGLESIDLPFEDTGSAKNNAYRWALNQFLKTGKTGKTDLAYYLDAWWIENPLSRGNESVWNNTLANHDFFISRRAFFFDLSPIPDERPIDDPEQTLGLDRETLEMILRAMATRAGYGIFCVGGFVPWPWKYVGPDGGSFAGSGGSRHPVQVEWEHSRLISAFNGYKDADAHAFSGMANASFHQHFPLEAHYPQEMPGITPQWLREAGLLDEAGKVIPRNYFAWYCGDYDAAAWLNRFVPRFWGDPHRGKTPLNWAFNPNLARRAPQAMHFARQNALDNEWFFAGDNGAGYLKPGMLSAPRLDPGMPDGWEAWIEHNQYWFERFGLNMTGFIIDGTAPGIDDYGFAGYARFSAEGVGTHLTREQWGVSPEGVPFAWVRDVGHPAVSVKAGIENVLAQRHDGLRFRLLRTILNSPEWHAQVADAAAECETVRFLSAPVFFHLIKLAARQE